MVSKGFYAPHQPPSLNLEELLNELRILLGRVILLLL